MQFLLEVSYEPASADALRTLVMNAGEKFSAAPSGKESDGLRVEGSGEALESCAA
jgi:hypothetical protein